MNVNKSEAFISYLSAARRRQGRFFLLLDLGLGEAAGGMGIEINTGYSCYLSAARRRQGRIGSGLGGSGMWNRNRDKHWVQLLFISSSSSFFNGQPLSLTMAFAQLSPSLEWSSWMRVV